MFHKKKFTLVDEKNQKKMYSAKKYKWVRYLVLVALAAFILLMILSNVKSKSYYQNLNASKNRTIPYGNRSILPLDGISTKTLDCTIKKCVVTCSGDMTNLKQYLESQKRCTSYALYIFESSFPDDRLPSNWLDGNFKLNYIEIKTSTLKGIDSGAFNHKSVAEVDQINLDDVELENIDENTFIGLKNVVTFKLINRIETFSGDGFLKAMQSNLENVTIKLITTTPTDPAPWFRGGEFAKLMTLYLYNNNFGGYINADTFQHLAGVNFIMLDSCKITHIADGAFDFIMKRYVAVVSLENNLLKRLSGDYLKNVTSLKKIYIDNNPWDCTCELEALINEVKRYPDGFGNSPKCSTPSHLAGIPFSDVSVESCDALTTTSSPITITSTNLPTSNEITDSGISQDPGLTISSEQTLTNLPTSTEMTDSGVSQNPTTDESDNGLTIPSEQTLTNLPTSTEMTDSGVSQDPTTNESGNGLTIPSGQTLTNLPTSTEMTDSGVSQDPTTNESDNGLTIPSGQTLTNLPTSTEMTDSGLSQDPTINESDNGLTIPSGQTTPSPQNRTTTLSADTIFVQCHRYNPNFSTTLNIPESLIELSRPDTHFTIQMISQTTVKMEIENPAADLALIWFYDQPNIDGSGENTRIIGEYKIGCQSDLDNSLLIEGLSQNRAYTFCLVREGSQVISPFNCQSYCTDDGYVEENDVWLKCEDQALTIGIFVIGIIISIFIGVVTTFLVLRCYPALLKSSKRVIVVNRSTGDVLILPRPCVKSSSADTDYSYKNSFDTNTTIHQRRFSEESVQSGLSYMVANNYEDIEYHWKMNIVKDMIYANRVPKSPAPPLPKGVSQSDSFSGCKDDTMKVSVILPKCNDYGYIA